MRLLYVIGSLGPGGAETSLAEMSPNLIAAGIDLHVLNLGPRQHMATALREAGATIHQNTGRTSRWASTRTIIGIARRIRPDSIHTTLFEADITGRTAAAILGIPSSSSIVGDSYGPAHYAQNGALKVNLARSLDAASARLSRRFHTPSKALAEAVPRRIGIPASRVDVIPRGRSAQRFPFRTVTDQRAARAKLGMDEDAKIILAVGRLEPVKGLDLLLRAAERLHTTHHKLTLLIAGKDGSASAELQRLAAQSPADIRFLGHRTDIPDLLTAADALSLPSLREGLPGAVLEAMAVGCPIAASDIPATRELLGPALDRRILFSLGDEAGLASAVNVALAHDSHQVEYIAHARKRFEMNFTIDSITAQMAKFFERVATDR